MKTCYVLAAWMVLVPFFLQAQPEHEKSAAHWQGLTCVHASVNNPCHPGLFTSL